MFNTLVSENIKAPDVRVGTNVGLSGDHSALLSAQNFVTDKWCLTSLHSWLQ